MVPGDRAYGALGLLSDSETGLICGISEILLQ